MHNDRQEATLCSKNLPYKTLGIPSNNNLIMFRIVCLLDKIEQVDG